MNTLTLEIDHDGNCVVADGQVGQDLAAFGQDVSAYAAAALTDPVPPSIDTDVSTVVADDTAALNQGNTPLPGC